MQKRLDFILNTVSAKHDYNAYSGSSRWTAPWRSSDCRSLPE